MKKINIISHRGANKYAPQNTIPAFKKSVEIGIDGFETEGKSVGKSSKKASAKTALPKECATLQKKLTKAFGTKVEMKYSDGKGKIAEKTLKELESYDFGGYFSPKYKNTKIPTVDEFLSFVEGTDISVLNIELKSPEENETAIVRETIRLVKEHGLFEKLIISSFDPKLLVEAKEIDQSTKTGLLYSPNQRSTYKNRLISRPIDYAKSIGVDAIHPIHMFVDERLVSNAHEAGILVNPWTVDSVKQIERMIKCGVDGIITNFPDVVGGLLDKYDY